MTVTSSLVYTVVQSYISLLIFCLDAPCIMEIGVLKSPTIIVKRFISLFYYASARFMYLETLAWCAYVYNYYFFLINGNFINYDILICF